MTQGFFQFDNSIINEILNFSMSMFELLFISGPEGSTKSEMLEYVMPEFAKENLVFRQFCFENTEIDDFLLNFYDSLRNFSLAKKISLKKFASANFKEKVSHYFKTIDKNCVISVENFEKVEKNAEIADFLAHLANYPNVKVIIVSKNTENNLFRFRKTKIRTIQIEDELKDSFKDKLKSVFKGEDDEIKNAYYILGGKMLYLEMSVKFSTITDVTFNELISEYERRKDKEKISYEEFLVMKYVAITPKTYLDLLKILCTLNHPVSIDFLNTYQLADTSNVNYLAKNYLVSYFKDEVYVKDYFKKYITDAFSTQEKIVYYKKLVKAYEQELTKSPKDRLLRLSRESIRKEIEFFQRQTPVMNSLSSMQKNFSYIMGNSQPSSRDRQKEILAEKMRKIKEKKGFLLNVNKNFAFASNENKDNQKDDENEDENIRKQIIQGINQSRELSENYNYKEAIQKLSDILYEDYKTDEFTIEIVSLIAQNYEKLNDFTNSQKYYQKAYDFAINKRDSRKFELEYKIAYTNKNLFKIEIAKEQFSKIANNENIPSTYRIKSFIEIGKIEEANSNIKRASDAFKKGASIAIGKNKELLCECYYRLGLLYDENQQVDEAVDFYIKNYTTSSELKENKYYSISINNLALIYYEKSKYLEAIKLLKLALHYDIESGNLENIYFTQKELAQLYSTQDKNVCQNYYDQALLTAQKLNDSFKEALIYFEKGEVYYDSLDDELALINFYKAVKSLDKNTEEENIERINMRIKDIKMRMDTYKYNKIREQYE